MKVLRHEEFAEQCKASCNGPYDGKWSKTMIGFGDEDNHFVLELTYNYGINSYKLGNDLIGITLESQKVIQNIKTNNYPVIDNNGILSIVSPDGYHFFVVQPKDDKNSEKVIKVSLSSSDLEKSVKYWHQLLEMNIFERNDKSVVLGFDQNQCKLELVDIKQKVNREKAFGRIAFSCPKNDLEVIESKMNREKQTILTPLTSLETEGKATVEVVILADPDSHEICFVGDQAFRQLSQMDSEAEKLLFEVMTFSKLISFVKFC